MDGGGAGSLGGGSGLVNVLGLQCRMTEPRVVGMVHGCSCYLF